MLGMQDGKELARDTGSRKEEQTKLLPHMSRLKNLVRAYIHFVLCCCCCVWWIILSLSCIRCRAHVHVPVRTQSVESLCT